jgi:hypothetical protein
MTDMPTKVILDCSTNEEQIVPLTQEEIDALEQVRLLEESARQAEEEAESLRNTLKQSARAKLVSGEPLTEEEAALLVL